MYDAINKGFKKVNGDILAWINSDDIYQDQSFEKIAGIFKNNENVSWLKGITDYINKQGTKTKKGKLHFYSQRLIRQGVYGTLSKFIQQDSVFWRKKLWKEVGGINTKFKLAGDYDLWVKFSKKAKLYSTDVRVSYFRKWEAQKSTDIMRYYLECAKTRLSFGLVSIITKITTRLVLPYTNAILFKLFLFGIKIISLPLIREREKLFIAS